MNRLSTAILPVDASVATLVGRVWLPGTCGGPTPVLVRDGELFDLKPAAPTLSELFELPDPQAAARSVCGPAIGRMETIQAQAQEIRQEEIALIGNDLSKIQPGSQQEARLKALLIEHVQF